MIELAVVIDGRTYQDLAVGLSDSINRFNQSVNSAGVPVAAALRKMLEQVHAAMVKQHGQHWNGRMPTGVPHLFARSGAGLASIKQSIRASTGGTADLAVGQIGASGPIASHEEAKTITAKSGKYLAIPLPPALNSRGLPLRPGPRDWDNTFVARSRRGNLLIFRRDGKTITPLYLLKTKVSQAAKLGLGKAIEAELPWFEARLLDLLERALDRA